MSLIIAAHAAIRPAICLKDREKKIEFMGTPQAGGKRPTLSKLPHIPFIGYP
ncbi:hypothetical protein [Desulfovibrio sp.]|uniref:hypothetical protein n=1 Tax=Desulfovibrio sp. TaxID=885 RepID=UPI0025BC5055|nr:hypothetical protein [Desulfovibrio sp.]